MNEATNSKASAPQDAGTGLLGSLLSNPQLLERAGGILSAALAGKEKEDPSTEEAAPSPSPSLTGEGPSGLSGILNDPALLAGLPSLLAAAKPLLAGLSPQSPKEEPPKSLPVCRDNLLLALKPFLSPERRQAVDTLLRVAKLGEILGQIK